MLFIILNIGLETELLGLWIISSRSDPIRPIWFIKRQTISVTLEKLRPTEKLEHPYVNAVLIKSIADGALSFWRTPPEPKLVRVGKSLPEPPEHLEWDRFRGVGPAGLHGPPGPCFSPGSRAQ